MNLLRSILAIFNITEIAFMVDILKHKHISNGVMFHCYQNNIAKSIHKIFNQHNILVSTVHITVNSSYYPSPYFHAKSAIIINDACDGWSAVLDSVMAYYQNYSYIIVSENLTDTLPTLSQYPIQVDSDVTVAHKINTSIDLYEVYNTGFHYNGVFLVHKLGHWDNLQSMYISNYDRKNLHGLKIRVAVVILPVMKMINETLEQFIEKTWTEPDIINIMKFFSVLKYMRQMYNISYDLLRVNSWGYNRNGTFDGMVGALRHGMADIGGAPCFFRSDRAKVIHYVSEVWTSRQSFIFRHPKHLGGFYKIYTRPISSTVWCLILALIVLTAIIAWLMFRIQGNRVGGEDTSLSLAGLVIWGAICQQGIFIRLDSISIKLAIFVTFVYALTLYQYYNATLVSSLLMEPPKYIRTLKDLLDSDLKLGAEDILYTKDYFKRTTDPVAIELYKRKIHTATHYNFFKVEDGMALVKKGGFALHVDTTLAFPIIKNNFREREICEIQLLQLYPLQKCGVIVRKNAPYKEHVSYGIRKMYEAGLFHRIRAVMDTPMPECVHTPDTSVNCVGLREFSTPLLGLTLGIILSLLTCLVEILVSKILKHRNNVHRRLINRRDL